MSAFENATAFFHACESLKGWGGCQGYVANGAGFDAQSEALVDVNTVSAYCDWMAGLGSGPLAGGSYRLHASGWDEANRTALFFATYSATHKGEGGPVPPTGRSVAAHYVYALRMNPEGKVEHMTKVWHSGWTMKALGWA